MKNKKIIVNYLYNLLYQIMIIVLPIITTPYLSRVLGAKNIGIYSYTVSIVTYFALLGALGINKYAQREIAYVQDDNSKLNKVFWEINIIKLFTVSISIIIYFLVFCLIGKYVLYYRLLLLELISVYFDISWFYQGVEEFKRITIRNFIMRLVGVIMVFIFVKSPKDLPIYIFIYATSNLLGNLLLWIKIENEIKIVPIKWAGIKRHIKPIISLFIPQIATSVYTVLDKVMLGMISNDMTEVGFYEQSQKIVKIALILITSLSIVMMPRISNINSKGDKVTIKKLMKKTFTFDYLLGFAIMFGIMGISFTFVPWFLGSEYLKVSFLILLSSPIIIFISISTTIGNQYLVSMRKQRIQTISVMLGAVINVILNCILIPILNSSGAAIATLISELLIAIIEIVFLIKKEGFNCRDIFTGFIKYFLCGVIMFSLVITTGLFMNPTILTTFIQIFEGVTIYIILLFLFKDENMSYLLIKIKKTIKKSLFSK